MFKKILLIGKTPFSRKTVATVLTFSLLHLHLWILTSCSRCKQIIILTSCSDPAIKQFLLHLDETLKLGRKFIIQDLDETHLFISADILEILQAKIDDLMDQISFPITEKGT